MYHAVRDLKEVPVRFRFRSGVLLLLVLPAAASTIAAEYYRLENVKRVEQDLYRSGNLYIQTQYCYHYTYGERALLKWEGEYGANSIHLGR